MKFLASPRFWFSVIAAGAVFLRFWALGDLPRGIFNDEAYNGADALRSLDEGLRVFYPKNFGREGLWIWLSWFTHIFIKPSGFALRLPSALAGVLTVLLIPSFIRTLTYFFTPLKSIPKKSTTSWLGIIIMLLVATSYWHLNFSRIAFRAILDPLFSLLAIMYAMRAYMNPKSWKIAALAGVFAALGLYGYGSFKFTLFPLLFVTIFGFFRFGTSIFRPMLLIILSGGLVAAPFLQFIFENQGQYFQRLNSVSVQHKESPVGAFFSGFWRMIRMFIDLGDTNKRHNYDQNTAINLISQIGVIVTFLSLIFGRLIQKKTQTQPIRPIIILFSLFWLLIMLVPPSLTHDGLPHALRGIGAVIPAYILAGVGLHWLFMRISSPILRTITIGVFVLASFSLSNKNYHVDFKSHGSSAFWFSGGKTEKARKAFSQTEKDVYIVQHPKKDTWDYQVYHYLAPSAANPDKIHFLYVEDIENEENLPNNDEKKILIGKKETLELLKAYENENVELWGVN